MQFMNRENALNLRSFWQIQIVGWCCFYLFDLLESIHSFLTRRVSIAEQAVPIFFMFLGSCALRPVCRRLRQSQSRIAFELKAAAAAVATSIPVAFAPCLILESFEHVRWHALVAVSMWSWFILFIWCSLYFSIKQWQQSSQERERLLRVESEVREARLLALRYQLNPHFLFNSLNAVSTLVLEGNAAAATRMLSQIGGLLRATLDGKMASQVPLSQEIALAKQYLAIEQTRLGERLHIDFAIAPESLNASVPNMLLQPLVENAVQHGVGQQPGGGAITIASRRNSDWLEVVVRNSGPRPTGAAFASRDTRNGIGLANTVERLKT